MSFALSKLSVMAGLQHDWPNLWFKDGADFDHLHASAIWTGEGSFTKDGVPVFDYYNESYDLGVLPEFRDWLKEGGWYAEAYDAGTWMLYPL